MSVTGCFHISARMPSSISHANGLDSGVEAASLSRPQRLGRRWQLQATKRQGAVRRCCIFAIGKSHKPSSDNGTQRCQAKLRHSIDPSISGNDNTRRHERGPSLLRAGSLDAILAPDELYADEISQQKRTSESTVTVDNEDALAVILKLFVKMGIPVIDGITLPLVIMHMSGFTGDFSAEAVLGITCGLGYVVYLYDRIKGLAPWEDTPEPTDDASDRFLWRHRNVCWGSLGAALLGTLAGIHDMPLAFQMSSMAILVSGLCYTAPILPNGHSMRTGPCMKNVLVPVQYTLAAALPLFATQWNDEMSLQMTAVAILHVFALAFQGTLFADFRDYEEDAIGGNTLSIPVILGQEGAAKLSMGLALVEIIAKAALLPQQPMLLLIPGMYFLAAERLVAVYQRKAGSGASSEGKMGAGDDIFESNIGAATELGRVAFTIVQLLAMY